jgi:hypothetical protein
MSKYAVAYINFFDNSLKLDIFDAEDWRDALIKMLMKLNPEEEKEYIDPFRFHINVIYEEAKSLCCEMEFDFEVKEIS